MSEDADRIVSKFLADIAEPEAAAMGIRSAADCVAPACEHLREIVRRVMADLGYTPEAADVACETVVGALNAEGTAVEMTYRVPVDVALRLKGAEPGYG